MGVTPVVSLERSLSSHRSRGQGEWGLGQEGLGKKETRG